MVPRTTATGIRGLRRRWSVALHVRRGRLGDVFFFATLIRQLADRIGRLERVRLVWLGDPLGGTSLVFFFGLARDRSNLFGAQHLCVFGEFGHGSEDARPTAHPNALDLG
jgi:hypothetical protein